MKTAPTIPTTADQRIVLNGVPWSHYEAQLALRGDRSVPRVSYLEGEMELRPKGYESVRRSRLFPDLDLDLLVTLLDRPTAAQAILGLREALRPAKTARAPRRRR
jgi:hypothetical protein